MPQRLLGPLLALALLAPSGVLAQTPAPAPAAPTLGGSKVVETLEVTKRLPGPALWKAQKGDSELFILGGITPLRHLQQWDQTRVQNAVSTSSAVLLPPTGELGVFDVITARLGGGHKLSGGRTLEQVLPPAERARFDRLIKVTRTDWKRYDHLKPGVAGVQLIADWRRAAGLSDAKPATTVERMAKAAGTPARPVASYKLKPMLSALAGLSDAAHLTCLNDAMDQLEFEAQHAPAAGEAWATADLAGVRANYSASKLDRCLQSAPTLEALLERATADTTRELQEVLSRPGKTTAVVDLALLLRANGVLDRLKAGGAEITVP